MPSHLLSYRTALLAWFFIFIFQIVSIDRLGEKISSQSFKISSLEASLNDRQLKISELASTIQSRAREMETFMGFMNMVPQDRGFVRTQKVISEEVQGLRRKASRWVGKDRPYILVDTRANKLYLKKGLDLLFDADCSVGRGGILRDKLTGRTWEFVTPLGEFRIQAKIVNPVWIKPDWAYVESKEPVPAPDDEGRRVEGELGAYVLSLGDGYLIHGTKQESFLGRAVSHGCVRLGSQDLERLYQTVPIGTKVYIY